LFLPSFVAHPFPRNLTPNFWLYLNNDQKGLSHMADLTDADKNHFIDKIGGGIKREQARLYRRRLARGACH